VPIEALCGKELLRFSGSKRKDADRIMSFFKRSETAPATGRNPRPRFDKHGSFIFIPRGNTRKKIGP